MLLIVPSKSQATLSSTVLQSSATLGTGKVATHQEQQDKAEDALIKKALLGQTGKRKRHQDVYAVHDHDSDINDDDNDQFGSAEEGNQVAKRSRSTSPISALQSSGEVIVVDSSANDNLSKLEKSQVIVGSALQRNADGSIVAPKIRVRSKGKQVRLLDRIGRCSH